MTLTALNAQELKIDLSKETVGKAPQVFEPGMGTWIVAQDGPDKVIKVDGSNYAASKSTPERLLIENARKMYGTSNEGDTASERLGAAESAACGRRCPGDRHA